MWCVYQAWPIQVSNQAGIRYGVCTRFDPLKYQTKHNSSGPIWHLHHGTLVLAQTSSGPPLNTQCRVWYSWWKDFILSIISTATGWKFLSAPPETCAWRQRAWDTYRQTKHTAVRWFSFSPTLPVKNPELTDDLPLQPGTGPNIATHASPTTSKFLFVQFLISWSVRFNVFPNLIPNFQLH